MSFVFGLLLSAVGHTKVIFQTLKGKVYTAVGKANQCEYSQMEIQSVLSYPSNLSLNQTILWYMSLCPHLRGTGSEIGKSKSVWSKHHLSQVCHKIQWGGRKKRTLAEFGSLFKLHTCADHKKRPIKALPGKPQQPVCFYKHTHIKYRETHKTCTACTTHISLIISPCCTVHWFKNSDAGDEVKQQYPDGPAGFPTRPEPTRLALRVSTGAVTTEPPKLPEAFECCVFIASVNVFVLGESTGGLCWRCAEQEEAISHLKHILPTVILHDITMTSSWASTDDLLLFPRTRN